MKRILPLLGTSLLAGCSAYGAIFGETKPMMTFVELNGTDGKASRLFVWSPKNTAALVNESGHGCIQGAEVFADKQGKLDLSADALKALAGLPPTGDSAKALGVEVVNSLIALRTASERNTYLGIGMFGLCQLQANGGLGSNELKDLAVKLFDNSLQIGPIATTSAGGVIAVPPKAPANGASAPANGASAPANGASAPVAAPPALGASAAVMEKRAARSAPRPS